VLKLSGIYLITEGVCIKAKKEKPILRIKDLEILLTSATVYLYEAESSLPAITNKQTNKQTSLETDCNQIMTFDTALQEYEHSSKEIKILRKVKFNINISINFLIFQNLCSICVFV
jgi:hypothetical protein